MKLTEIKRCQLRQLEALKFIDRICKVNHLRYYAHTGTLLGAARHSGYIPWDMDTDILMPEKDTQRLLQIVSDMKSPLYAIVSKNENWAASDRLIIKNVKCYGSAALTELDEYVHIDIYSYGHARKHHFLTKTPYNYATRIIHRLIEYRMGRDQFQNKRAERVIRLCDTLLHKYSCDQLRNRIKKLAVQKDISDNITVYNSFYGFAKETYPIQYYRDAVLLPFEDMQIPAPKHYEQVLTQLYGNWREYPPENERYPQYIEEMVYNELT